MDCWGTPGDDDPVDRRLRPTLEHLQTARGSLPVWHVEAGIEESHRGLAGLRVDAGAIDARRVDAGLREFIPAGLVALVDEDVVVDAAWDDVRCRWFSVYDGERCHVR